MWGKIRKSGRCLAIFAVLSLCIPAAAWARDPVMVDRNGMPRSERAQWVYRIVARWGDHVREAYRTDTRRWAESMGPVFAKAPLPVLRKAAQARSFTSMNDALLGAASPTASIAPTGMRRAGRMADKALGDLDRDLVYVPVTPCRILDTRVAGGVIPANSFRDFDLTDVVRFAPQGGDTSNCGIGDKGSFAAAALNITVVNPGTAGYITAFPYLASQPTAATINYTAGDIRNGLAIVRLDQSPATYEFSVYSFAQTHLVADVVGYFREPEATSLQCVTLASNPVPFDGRSLTIVDSPACPAGYAVSGGACDGTTGNTAVAHSTFSENGYRCKFAGIVSTYVGTGTSFVRCCRTAGK